MSQTRIIALAGLKGSGKSTCANLLVNRFGGAKLSFAGPLKKVALEMLGLDYEQVYGPDKIKDTPTKYRWEDMPFSTEKTGIMTARQILQSLGTEIFRKIDENIHVKAFFREVENLNAALIINDDCRYTAEAFAVFDAHPENIILRLTRTNGDRDFHSSENGLNGFVHPRYIIFDNSKMSMNMQEENLLYLVKKRYNLY